MDRKLVSIQRIANLEPIEGADKIEKATILGWKCVTQKGNFKVGDLCVFFEVDSLIPRKKWSEFLFKGDKADKGEVRLRTVRLRKQISQGLAMPMNTIFNDSPIRLHACDGTDSSRLCLTTREKSHFIPITDVVEGRDLTELLGVTKYEPPVSAELAGLVKGSFPAFMKKTDETRIQVVPQILEKYKGVHFYVAEKIDGSSMTVYYKDGEFGVCSRNLDLKETEGNAFWRKARELDLENKLKSIAGDFAIQGELYGEGIQKNKYKVKGIHFAVFNIFDIRNGVYLNYDVFKKMCFDLGLDTVPIVEEYKKLEFDNVDAIVNYSIGASKLNPEVQREGVVFRPVVESFDEDLIRLSFKIINPEFLLMHNE